MSLNPQYPILGVGAVVFHHDAVLLVKRAQPPYAGEWAIPGGKVRLGETLQHAAEREIFEETGIRIKAGETIYSFEIIQRDHDAGIRYHYVVIDLQATYLSGEPHARDDASATGWITRDQLQTLPVNDITRTLLANRYQFF